MKVEQTLNHIAGAPCPALGGEWIENRSPATGQVRSLIPRSGEADVDRACEAAFSARKAWADTPGSARADLLDRIAEGIEARLDIFARLESEDTGKPLKLARDMDIRRAIANFRFFAGAIRHDFTQLHEMHGQGGHGALNYTIRRPVGVAALITPWNLPLYLLSWKVAPALAMGNPVVCKPSEFTPRTASLLADVIHEVGLPSGVFNLLHGYGPEVGGPLVSHPRISLVSFTGGTVTGAKVAAAAAPSFKKLSLELGGKNPTLVFADADFEAAVAGAARAAFANQGEICLCGSRILVERGIHDRFVEALVERVQALKVGDPADASTDIGALISHAHRDKVESYLALAEAEGGSIRCGGRRPALPSPFDEGAFLEPAVITGLSPSCRTATEEIFGPVVTVHPFDTEAEAIEAANTVRYGLSASLWTTNLSRAHRVSAALDTGMVWVNTWLLRDLRVPFGGVKDSGVGREGGHHSVEFYSEARNICIQL